MTYLEFIRKQKKLSQSKLGNLIQMHPTNITLIENGHRKSWPNLRRKLSEVLCVSEDCLFDEGGALKLIDNVTLVGEKL